MAYASREMYDSPGYKTREKSLNRMQVHTSSFLIWRRDFRPPIHQTDLLCEDAVLRSKTPLVVLSLGAGLNLAGCSSAKCFDCQSRLFLDRN